MTKFVTAAGIVAIGLCSGLASARPDTTVFSTDFESGAPAEWGGTFNVELTQGLSAFGFDRQFSRNAAAPAQPTTLTLTNLPAHDSVSIKFLLAIIDSWDGDGGNPGPDSFNIAVDGNTVFSHTFASASGSSNYNAPAGVFLGAGNFGFNSWNDYVYDLGLDPTLSGIAHTASTLTIDLYASGPGWQGFDDESWGVDNVVVSVNTVPAPGALGIAGAGLLAGLRRRR